MWVDTREVRLIWCKCVRYLHRFTFKGLRHLLHMIYLYPSVCASVFFSRHSYPTTIHAICKALTAYYYTLITIIVIFIIIKHFFF